MAEPIEVMEQRIERLRVAVREALVAGDRQRARALRAQLRQAERAWEDALAQLGDAATDNSTEPTPRRDPDADTRTAAAYHGGQSHGPLLPLRDQVHEALSLLTVPASPRLIATVHEAFFTRSIPTARMTSLRRDEERSFTTSKFARPYYICAALTAELLAPARGLLALSTWPMETRIIGPLTSRVNFLTAAIHVAENIQRLAAAGPAVTRLLWRFAANIPGAPDPAGTPDPRAVAAAARAELTIHAEADLAIRRSAALRARRQLDEVEQLFGHRLHLVHGVTPARRSPPGHQRNPRQ